MVIEKLESHELFGLLSHEEVGRLRKASQSVKLTEGQTVYSSGAPADYFYVLLKGRVELKRPTKGGLNLLVDDLVEGNLFGVSSITGTAPYLLTALCVEDSDVLKIEGRVLRQLLDENPRVGYATQKRIAWVFFNRYVNTMERLQTVAQAIPFGTA